MNLQKVIMGIKYIDLNHISAQHVLGKWEVTDRMVNSDSNENIFSDIRLIELEETSYTSINGKKLFGEWNVKREDKIIYNPQLRFFINGEPVAKAIITRLMQETSESGELFKLTLYFNTGLELVLHKKTEQPNKL